jgi:hypothetical protein
MVSHETTASRIEGPGVSQMPAQKHETRKNYIGLLADEADEAHAVAASKSAGHGRMSDYVRDLMAAMLRRGGKAQ